MRNCDPRNPTMKDCTPFAGGRLMARFAGGDYDSYGWDVTAVSSNTFSSGRSCTAFPIAVASGIRSVTPSGEGSNPYPLSIEFDYPANPPIIYQFFEHRYNQPLSNAKPGSIFKVKRNDVINGFDWLVWNLGITEADGSVLSNSLTWPGDSFDYTDHGDAGTPAANSIAHVVRGFVQPGDNTDMMLQKFDMVARSRSQLPAIAPAVQTLIDDGSVLRVIVQDDF